MANPRAVYTEYALTTGQWYDLCPEGTGQRPFRERARALEH